MRTYAALFAVSLVPLGCASKLGAGADGGAEGGGASSELDGGAGAAQAQGADCIKEATTGLQICSAVSICPNIVVDHDIFPNCGFRIRGQTLDLECACDTMICPLGSPATCEQAKALLSQQTEAQVCQQVNEGRCTPGAGTGSSSGSSGSGTAGSGCDKTCAGECAGDPNCVRLCGC